jgi:hypothetical protein
MGAMKETMPEVDDTDGSNEEMYERTHEILTYLKDVLPPEDFSLMCYHTGFSYYDFFEKE